MSLPLRAWSALEDPVGARSVLLVSPDAAERTEIGLRLGALDYRPLAPPRIDLAAGRLKHVDLLLVDFTRPARCLGELCQQARERYPRLPRIAIVDGANVAALRAATDLRFDGYLYRPFSDEELGERLRSALLASQRVRADQAVAAKHRTLVEVASAGLFVINGGRFSYVNREFARLFDYEVHDIASVMTIHDLVIEEERFSIGSRFQQWMESEAPSFRCSFRGKRRGGRVVEVELHGTRVDVAGRRVYAGTLTDVTRRREAQTAKQQQAEYFRALIERAQDMITVLDRDGAVVYGSPSIRSVLGHAPEDMVGRSIFDLVHPGDVERARAALARMLSGQRQLVIRLRVGTPEGSWRLVEASVCDLLDDAVVRGIVVNSRDVTEQQAAEKALRSAALTDTLTGLPNRALFSDRLSQAAARSRRRPDTRFAVLFLDLDGFKMVNDSLGHAVGDTLLVSVARRLQSVVRPEDTVARFGGDEFAILLADVRDVRHCTLAAGRILEALSSPFDADGYEVFTSASIGIVVHSPGDEGGEEMLRDADVAMYRAKARRSAYEVFDPAMHLEVVQRLKVETDLRRAVAASEMRVHFQPIVELATGGVAGFEALVRWEHPERGMVPPADFIGIAEETGQIEEIGHWVLNAACQQVRAWQQEFRRPDLFVAVNLSARQLRLADLVRQVRDALREAGIEGPSLKLEITESMVIDDTDRVVRTLRQLKQLGVQLYMDDFGTGYASLGYLHRLPVDGLKIDRSFVSPMHTDPRHAVLVQSTVGMASALGLKIVAEGIELADHANTLRELGCEYGQGYHFSRPVGAAAAREFLRGTVGRGPESSAPGEVP